MWITLQGIPQVYLTIELTLRKIGELIIARSIWQGICLSKVFLKKMKKLTILFSLFLVITGSALASLDMLDDIANALRSGDSRSVSRYFGNTVDLTIISQEEVYSKTQAEQVLQDFLSKNPPRSFVVVHQGTKVGAKYAIGTYVSNQGVTYRVYFFVKQSGTGEVIQDLRFEKE